jgi:hypothetical protein
VAVAAATLVEVCVDGGVAVRVGVDLTGTTVLVGVPVAGMEGLSVYRSRARPYWLTYPSLAQMCSWAYLSVCGKGCSWQKKLCELTVEVPLHGLSVASGLLNVGLARVSEPEYLVSARAT